MCCSAKCVVFIDKINILILSELLHPKMQLKGPRNIITPQDAT